MKKYLNSVVALLSLSVPSFGATSIKVDPAVQQSFPFNVLSHVFDSSLGLFFVGANEEVIQDDDKIFSLSYAAIGSTVFIGIAPKKVVLNGNKDVDNPMHGAQISHLGLIGPRPVAVLEKAPQNIYIVNQFSAVNAVELLAVENINDAEGNVTAGVAAFISNAPGQTFSLPKFHNPADNFPGSAIFAAVKKSGGTFGEVGAGIALLGLEFNKELQPQFVIKDAQNGEPGNLAAPFDVNTPQLFINNAAAQLNDAVTLYNNFNLGLYIGVQPTAGAGATDGVRAIVRCNTIEGGKLKYREIAPSTAFDGGNEIIGAVGAGEQVSIHRIDSIITSTWLDYLIVVGGNGDSASTKDQVYALPLVGINNLSERGNIANKNSIPVASMRLDTGRFSTRSFVEPAKLPDQMPLTTDPAARVGGGPLGAPITDIFTTLDTVFVTAGEPFDGQQPGIFYSQALFDNQGRISQWTPWRRAGAVGSFFGLAFDAMSANFLFMKGVDANNVNSVQQTLFGKIGFSYLLSGEFPQDEGGVQGVVEFPLDSPGFSAIAGERLSVILWPGNQKVVLSQAGADDDDMNFGPISVGSTFESKNGSLAGFMPSPEITNLSISGGELSKIDAAITGAEVIVEGQGYFIVGGFGGIAVLADENGNGFDAAAGLKSGFIGLHDQLAFKVLGNFSHVRKIIVDNNTLYVVTDQAVEKLRLCPEDIAAGKVAREIMTDGSTLTSYGMGDTISDAVISNGFAIIATSAGVYFASGLEESVDQTNLNWQRIELNDSTRSSTRLVALGPKEGFDKKGMVLVYDAYVSLNETRIYRLIVDSDNAEQPIQKVPDIFFIGDGPSFFVNVGAYRNYFATDGATWFVMRSKFREDPVMFQLYSPGLRSGLALGERSLNPIGINIKDARAIGPMVRSMTSGEWFIVGDFGIRGNG